MTTERGFPAAVATGGYIYAIGGSDDTFALLNSVERTAISPLVFTNLSPSIVPASQPTATTISGTNFLPTAMLQLGSTPVLTTSFVSTTTLTAIVHQVWQAVGTPQRLPTEMVMLPHLPTRCALTALDPPLAA
jgi:hypothetical protein